MTIRKHDTVRFSDNAGYDFEIRTVLGRSVEGASDPGEVLAATAAIHPGDHEAWFSAWNELGYRASAIAERAASEGHHVSAAGAYLRAANYYSVAVNAISALPDTTRLLPTFQLQQAAWTGFIDNVASPVEKVEIPYETSTLPGYYFTSQAADSHDRRTLIAVNGSDGSLAGLYASVVAPALRRGYDVLIFDGPGQQTQLFEQNGSFRPDWESVITPVFDFVAERDDVNAARIAVYGISQGGNWVARAIAFEHRFTAAIVDPGVVDVATSWTSQIPHPLLLLLNEGKNEKFDRDMELGMKFSPETARTWQFRARPYGKAGYAETITEVRRYTVADVAGQITTPLLILSPEDEQFWPGQAEQLASLTPNVSTLVKFTAAEGAAGHCQPLARELTAQRIFDWLDEKLTN